VAAMAPTKRLHESRDAQVKKVIAIVGAAVLAYSLIVYPAELAEGTRTALGWGADAIEAVISFMRGVFA
jgi:hypothetical protein